MMQRRRHWLGVAAVLAVLGLVLPQAARGDGQVDPDLVGTWQLSWSGQPIYWEIRQNGTYRISGPGAGPGHAGRFEAAAGKWSLRSAAWQDQGTYRLANAGTFTGTGKLGPATWVRAQAAPVQAAGDRRSRPAMSEADAESYIADYNAQWEKAAAGLRRLTTRPARGVGGYEWSPTPYTPSENAPDSGPSQAEIDQQNAEARAYWGEPGAYDRVRSGNCTWSDSNNYGC